MSNKHFDEYLNKVGGRLKEERERLGYTQEEFSEKLNVDLSTYKRRELGKNQLTCKDLFKLYKVFGIDIERLIVGETTTTKDRLSYEQTENIIDEVAKVIRANLN